MKLKEYSRKQYEVNPLFEVVCQLRFPTILKISEVPSEFQEKIRGEYPIYSKKGLPKDIPQEILANIQSQFPTYHNFSDEKEHWQINLSQNDITLVSLGHYISFEDLRERLGKIISIFEEIYKPSFYNRVGLRYKNLINDEQFDFNGEKWNQLIPKHVAPELHEEDKGEERVKEFNKKIILNDGDETINLSYVFSPITGSVNGKEVKDKLSYIIDIDCFTEGNINGKHELFSRIDSFKKNIRNLFGYSITKILNKIIEQTKSDKQ